MTPQNKEYTFTQFFYDEACTQRVISDIPVPENEGSAVNPVIYAQYIKGDWTIVETAANVRDMINNPQGKNYWFAGMSAEKVIDCSSFTRTLRRSEFAARVEGNGYTLKGIHTDVNSGYTLSDANAQYSLFGQFTDKTVIRNLTVEDLTVWAKNSKDNVSVYLINNGVSGATLENLTFKNVTLTVDSNTNVANIPALSDGYLTNNWLFGGLGADSAFLGAYKGVKVDGAKLTINDTAYNFGE